MTLEDDVRAMVSDAGFPFVRFAPAVPNPQVASAAQAARDEGRLADMHWMTADWIDRAANPGAFLEGARSVVMVALPYQRNQEALSTPGEPKRGRIAAYAAGRDYHRVFESKLRRLARALRERFACGARPTVDYGPLLERPLAGAAGMGWLGKSSMLLVPGAGPYVLLGAIVTTLELQPDRPLRKSCGSCTRCVAACPTGALAGDGTLDARLCISYHTIENRGPVPRELRSKFGAWIFGCDDCLDVCPPGFRRASGVAELSPREGEGTAPELTPLLDLDEERFQARFQGRAIMRAKRDGFVRNVCIALGNTGSANDLPALLGALNDTSPLVRGHAAWAIARLAIRAPSKDTAATARSALERRAASESDTGVLEELTAALHDLSADAAT